MTIDEAVKKFADDFSAIPTGLIIQAYKENPENLECLNTSEFLDNIYLDYWPAMWGWLFKCRDWTDEEWIRRNISKVEEIGFIIYDCEHCGILLGINSAGHDFYEAYWKPLYFARNLKWHEI